MVARVVIVHLMRPSLAKAESDDMFPRDILKVLRVRRLVQRAKSSLFTYQIVQWLPSCSTITHLPNLGLLQHYQCWRSQMQRDAGVPRTQHGGSTLESSLQSLLTGCNANEA